MKFPFARLEVQGESMFPNYKSGDCVIVFTWTTIKPGDIVVFQKNGMMMIKRASKKEGNRWIMRGDNLSDSTDSLDFGDVLESQIFGKVIAKY